MAENACTHFSGEAPPRERVAGDPAPPPMPQSLLSHPIWHVRPRLDLDLIKLKPQILIQWIRSEDTLSPGNLAKERLSFFKINPPSQPVQK
jgi:hypothetical protein